MPKEKLAEVKEELAGEVITFKIKGVKIHLERRTGDYYWLAVFELEHRALGQIRKKLDLPYMKHYNDHIVSLELKF